MHANRVSSAHTGTAAYAQRQKALRMIYDLKFTFGMDDLARVFLQRYAIVQEPAPAAQFANRQG